VGDVRYEVLAEEHVPEEGLAQAAELLDACFGGSKVRGRSWILRRPLYRVLAWDGEVLVGNEMGCLVGCTPRISLHAFADAAVRPEWRSGGVARAMGALLHEEAIRRDAAAVVCHTGRLGRVAAEHGMEAVRPGELFLRRRPRRPLPLVENWYVRWHRARVVPLTIHHWV
jgi:GNAT superfamily N-acetyltransferase